MVPPCVLRAAALASVCGPMAAMASNEPTEFGAKRSASLRQRACSKAQHPFSDACGGISGGGCVCEPPRSSARQASASMTTSRSRCLRRPRKSRSGEAAHAATSCGVAGNFRRLFKPPSATGEDDFRGRIGRARGGATGRGTSGALGARLSKALAGKRFGGGHGHQPNPSRAFSGDNRQRVIAKVSFHKHGGGGGGGGKLLAHAQYLERDGAAREGERGRFYDREHDLVEDAREQLREWELDDRRHFRIMLAPESGVRFVIN